MLSRGLKQSHTESMELARVSRLLRKGHRRPNTACRLSRGRDLLGHSRWRACHDCPQSTSVGLQEKGTHRSLDQSRWLYGLEGLDCADNGLPLAYLGGPRLGDLAVNSIFAACAPDPAAPPLASPSWSVHPCAIVASSHRPMGATRSIASCPSSIPLLLASIRSAFWSFTPAIDRTAIRS
jgi:hypothetical protein